MAFVLVCAARAARGRPPPAPLHDYDVAESPWMQKGHEFVLVTIWEDVESLRAYTGAELGAVRLAEEERPLVDSCRVEVYEHRDDVI